MSAPRPRPTAQDVLDLWEGQWGQLSDDWRTRFLSDRRLSEICQYHLTDVRTAVKKNRKLDDIVQEARQLTKARAVKTRRSTPTAVRAGGNKRKSRKRSGRSNQTNTKVPTGSPGGASGFYGMPRPQKPEAPAGTCQACGVMYGMDGRCRC